MQENPIDAVSRAAGVRLGITTPPPSLEPLTTFATGAKRSENKASFRFDLLPLVFQRRVAARFGMGAEKYGEYNWEKGIPAEDIFAHIQEHLLLWAQKRIEAKNVGYDQSLGRAQSAHPHERPDYDDDLAGAAWGIAVLMHFEEHGNRAYEVDVPF